MKYIKFCVMSMLISLFAGTAYANGNCTGPGGAPNTLTADLGTTTITNPDNNTPGYVISSAYNWTLPGYTENCSCVDDGASKAWWYWTTTTTLTSESDNWLKYSDYLDARLMIVDAHWSKYVPFSNAYTNQLRNDYKCNVDLNYGSQATGSHGKLDLRINKAFVGTVNFPATVIASLYSCEASDSQCEAKGSPTINYIMSGTVVVPQNCVIDSGQVISIDFGNLYSGDFTTAGQKPNGAIEKTFNVPIKCTNIDAPANLTLRVEGTPSTHYVKALASDNDDVGVVVTDEQGTILTPNNMSSVIPFVTDTTGNANVTLKAYPVSTTGNTPSEGVFTALAYLRVDFA